MAETFLIIALIAGIFTVIAKALSYIFDVVDDFRPFTFVWYDASVVCDVISEFLFMGSTLALIISALMYLIGG